MVGFGLLISYNIFHITDFEETVKSEPLLLEAFGACLPGERHLDNFMKDILDRPDGVQQIKNFYLGPGLSV